MHRLSVSIVLLWLFASPASAYPIPPVTLWELVQKSDLVVLADVIEVVEDNSRPEPKPDDANAFIAYFDQDSTARLRVRETWKGEVFEAVDVQFPRFLICPAPPRYVEGKVVIAFLTKREKAWETTALSYGTLYPRKEDAEDFRSLIKEAATLQQSSRVSRDAMLAWHVKAASRPSTRWDGLYLLVPESDDLHYYAEQHRNQETLAKRLSLEQLRQIAEGFTQAPSTDRTLPMILTLLTNFPDTEVDRAAASSIEALLAGDHVPWWIKSALYLTLKRFGDPDPTRKLIPLGDTFADVAPEQVKSIWEKARRDLAIPKVPAAKILEEEVWGVGSNTPD